MKILLTGSEGFIGTNLKKHLEHKYTIYGWDLKSGKDIFDHRIERVIKEVDIVIHLAALTSVEQSFSNPTKVFDVNVNGTARIAHLCHKYKKKLIYPSSAAVIYPDLSPYAKSKAIAEEIVKGVGNAVILRFFNVYGPDMNPDSGSIMYNFLHSRKLKVYGDGSQTRDFINVKDICRIIEQAFKNKWNGKVVECGTGYTFTVNYIAGLFAHFKGLSIEYMPPRREIKWSVADRKVLDMLYKRKLVTNLEKDIEELCRT
jgi:UDP-glucose 4-epimerase